MPVLETEHLLLRPLTLADVDALAALYADPEVMYYFDGTRSREQTRIEVESVIAQYERTSVDFLATVHRESGQLIGRCGLLWQVVDGRQEVEVAYMLARPFWGRGLGTEAARALRDHGFRDFDFPRLISLIHPENRASMRVAEKNGMTFERELTFEGYAHVLYAITREEWMQPR